MRIELGAARPPARRACMNGGVLRAGIPDNPDHLDTGISYAVEGWELLEATNNGLLTFKKAAGAAGSQVVARHRDGDAGGHRRRPHLHLPRASRRALLAAGEPRGAAVRLRRTRSSGCSTSARRASASTRSSRARTPTPPTTRAHISGIVANDKAMTDRVPPDPPRRRVPGHHGDAVRVRRPGRDAVQGHLHRSAVAGGDRAVHDQDVRPQAADRARAQPELPPVVAQLARRAPERGRACRSASRPSRP